MTINITSSDFNHAWYLLIKEIIKNGEESTIGDSNTSHKIKGSTGMITLKNNAIKQIECFEIHPDYPFKSIQQYINQFTYEWQKENGSGGFSYTYFNRLTNYKNEYNQLNNLKCNLQSQIYHDISSNRNHAITWIPEIDSHSVSPPCLQSINIKYINNNKVDIFLYWRSRDAYTAWQSNIIAIIQMLNKYVIKPNNCSIRFIIDFCNNYHIYKSDISAASKISSLNPQISYQYINNEYFK
jgi:thymidylate synthase